MDMKRCLILYNVKSGKGSIDGALSDICDVFIRGGYEVREKLITFSENPLEGESDMDLVVVCGGDGTVNFVINSMKRLNLDLTLGIIPSGTANDFAGALGMKSNRVKAAEQIISGEEKRVDVGKVNDLYFINVFSFGLFTTTSQHTPDAIKHKIGKFAYIIEGSRELFHLQTLPLTIEHDGVVEDVKGLMLLVFNGETAGKFHLARQASVRDGLLDVVFLKKTNPFTTVASVLKYLVSGKLSNAVRYLRTSKLIITSGNHVDTDMDGQKSADFPLTIECLPGDLKIICPVKE